jgi:primosomal protein N' (replication factor Y)
MSVILSILPATGIDRAYSYKVDEALPVGTYVKIGFGRQEVVGVVWDTSPDTDIPLNKIKAVKTVYDAPSLSPEMCRFVERVAQWTMTPKGLILKMVIPSFKLLDEPKRPLKFICTASGTPDAVHLSDDQGRASDSLRQKVRASQYSTTLLDGVTGAGKTEVFFEAAEEAMNAGKQVLIMMPEIALTGGFVERFERRFGMKAALWHSQMTPKQRQTVWQGVANGVTKAVIGARSSLFLPYADLGVVVVDEEHDPSYKQEENVVYNARDMAVLRGSLFGHAVILSSATPSLETVANVRAGRYDVVKLPDRYGGALLPDMHLIDMREEKPERGEFISDTLHSAIAEALGRGEQSLLFLNRRGYAPLTLCRSCGGRLECPQCTAWLVEHKNSGRTFCHHCGYGGRTPNACPHCDEKDSLTPIGPGVERIAEEIQARYPDAKTLILSSDTTEDGVPLHQTLEAIRSGAIDIIIGTQMTAKGHHFPRLTCVGIVDADLGMNGGDLRASERTWQLLHQVAGRAGREVLAQGRKGQVYVQTYLPDNTVMQSLVSHDREAFINAELEARKLANMPPYHRLVGIILSGKHEKTVEDVGRALARSAPQSKDFVVMGPAVPAFAMLRGNHRRRLLVQAGRSINVQKTVDAWMGQVDIPSSVRLTIDIDPQSFL